MKPLSKQQRYYLKTICERGTLQFGWGGMKSTRVVCELEQRGLIRLQRYPVVGSTGFHWSASPTNAGIKHQEEAA